METKTRRRRSSTKKVEEVIEPQVETATKDSKTKAALTPMTEKQAMLLFTIDQRIDELYKKKAALVKKIVSISGPLSECILKVDGEKPFARVKVIDQNKAFEDGSMIYKSSGISRYTSTISRLAKAPKSTTKA